VLTLEVKTYPINLLCTGFILEEAWQNGVGRVVFVELMLCIWYVLCGAGYCEFQICSVLTASCWFILWFMCLSSVANFVGLCWRVILWVIWIEVTVYGYVFNTCWYFTVLYGRVIPWILFELMLWFLVFWEMHFVWCRIL
jgi:hypothetical protein